MAVGADREIVHILKQVRRKEIGITEAAMAIARFTSRRANRADNETTTKRASHLVVPERDTGAGCHY